jgi:hypothetical protein
LFAARQSAYRRHHSTETTVVSDLNDIIRAVDSSNAVALVLLDLSAAFDSVDHSTLVDVLHHRFAVDDVALMWFRSYLDQRMQSVIFNGIQSAPTQLLCGVPQGSVLGPLEFISYTENVVEVFERINV